MEQSSFNPETNLVQGFSTAAQKLQNVMSGGRFIVTGDSKTSEKGEHGVERVDLEMLSADCRGEGKLVTLTHSLSPDFSQGAWESSSLQKQVLKCIFPKQRMPVWHELLVLHFPSAVTVACVFWLSGGGLQPPYVLS